MIEVIDGKAHYRLVALGMRGAVSFPEETLQEWLDALKARNAELAADNRIQEVFRSEYVTVYRRDDGLECVVKPPVSFPSASREWMVGMCGPRSGGNDFFDTRAEADAGAKKALLEYREGK